MSDLTNAPAAEATPVSPGGLSCSAYGPAPTSPSTMPAPTAAKWVKAELDEAAATKTKEDQDQ
ncbi:hypothetical protein ACFQ7N_39365 [Streptomyces niveus]|uniref:hypothetical protein n=1 Tax=Streptomyces niveus TaxID=193462 RepID=UPI00369797AE